MEKIQIKLPGNEDFFTQEAYKTLRTNLLFCGSDIKSVVITSCHENEGKTIVTLQLGKSLAELGKKVLVVDADMRKSVIAGRNAKVDNPQGLSEILTKISTFDKCRYQTQYENLDLVFAGQYPPNPVELVGSPYFTELLSKAGKEYDYILIDTPPLGSVIDAAVISAKCDGTIVVISDKRVRVREAQAVIDQLKKSNVRILGAVRNNVSKKRDGYYKKGYYR